MQRLWKTIPWLVALALLLWVLRSVPLAETWQALRQLRPWQIGVLVVANGLVVAALTARWWLLLRGLGERVPFGDLGRVRVAAFGLSYFTPGPQVGGEPLQVALVERRHGASRSAAVAAVTLDKAIELLVNFGFLLLGVALVVQTRLLAADLGRETLLFPLALLALPMGLLTALWGNQRPLSRLLGLTQRLPIWRWQPIWQQRVGRAVDGLSVSEADATALMRENSRVVVSAVGVALLAWLLMLAEFWLMASFLGVVLTPLTLIVAVTAVRIAFLLPLPGGIGVVEASLALAFEAIGAPAAIGVSLALLIRARDVILGSIGLWWGSHSLSGMGTNTYPTLPFQRRVKAMTDRLNNRVYAIIVLTLATAVIHLALSFNPFNPLFILNAIGYVALLIGLYFIPSFSESLRNIIRWVFIGYTALTIVLYFVFNGSGAFSSPVGLLDKGIELALIIMLWLDRGN